jgi:hypothetical protein
MRLKLPTYGKALLQERNAGHHPLCAHLIIGRNSRLPLDCAWQAAGEVHPQLEIKPEQCAAGVFDWTLLCGLNVVIFDRSGRALEFNDPDREHRTYWGHGPFYFMVGEIALYSAEIEIRTPWWDRSFSAHEIAASVRAPGWARMTAKQNHGWPGWWSEEIENLNAKQRQIWCRAALIERHDLDAFASQ